MLTRLFYLHSYSTNIDPYDEDSGSSDLYLRADLSISCTDSYYHGGVLYAVIMVIIYPIGIPSLYCYILYANRAEIRERDLIVKANSNGNEDNAVATAINPMQFSFANDEETGISAPTLPTGDEYGGTIDDNISRISFLWEAYKPECWYWEIIETTRRLMLTAVLSICDPGSSSQSVFAVLLGLFYIKLYGYFSPYADTDDNVIAETGQFQIFLTFFGALIMQNHLLGEKFTPGVSVLLIALNTMVCLMVCYIEYRMSAGDNNVVNTDNTATSKREMGDADQQNGVEMSEWKRSVVKGDNDKEEEDSDDELERDYDAGDGSFISHPSIQTLQTDQDDSDDEL